MPERPPQPFVYDDQWIILDNSAIGVPVGRAQDRGRRRDTSARESLVRSIGRSGASSRSAFISRTSCSTCSMSRCSFEWPGTWPTTGGRQPSDLRPTAPIIVAFAGFPLRGASADDRSRRLHQRTIGAVRTFFSPRCCALADGCEAAARWWIATGGCGSRPSLRRSPMFPVVLLCYDRWLVGGDAMARRSRCCDSTCRCRDGDCGGNDPSPSSSPWNIRATCRCSGCRFWTRST